MKPVSIAVISDIHGNVPALAAVLEDLERVAPDEILVGGDLVGRGPEGSRVAQRIATLGWPCVRGNHEDYLLSFRHGRVPDDWLEADHWSASRWMAADLTDEDEKFIDSLPMTITSELCPELRLVHGSPRSNNEGIGPWNADQEIERHLGRIEEPLLVCAHTHRPMIRRFDSGLVLNVGSVGLPFNRDRRAQYALLHRNAAGWEVELRQVEYDLGRILQVYETSGFLERGGITARLLRLELEHAAPFLVPFLRWVSLQGLEPSSDRLAAFRQIYDPGESMGAFFHRLEASR